MDDSYFETGVLGETMTRRDALKKAGTVGLSLLAGRGLAHADVAPDAGTGKKTLKELATALGVDFGYALRSRELADHRYRDIVLRDSTAVGSEFEMVTKHMRTDDGGFLWKHADSLVDFAEQNKLPFYGHDFLHNDIPSFITGINDRTALIGELRKHIETITRRYRGRIRHWHIGTELFVPEGLRKTHWCSVIGPEYLDMAFRFAHEADPAAVLMLNEVRIEEISPWSDLVYEHVRRMLERNVPLHAIGFHALRDASWAVNEDHIASMLKNWERFAALGLKIYISEMGLYISSATEKQFNLQAQGYKNIVSAALSMRPKFKGFIVFGVGDHLHWTVYRYKTFRYPLLFNEDYSPKPAYHAVRHAFELAKPL